MSLGQRLYNLRKSKQLSQEEVDDKLNVSRQTISKWETDQSTPDFDKIVPLCELYEISTDELLIGKKVETVINIESNDNNQKQKKAKAISISILLYFISVAWIMVSIPVFMINPILASAIFLIICGIATFIIVYTSIIYKEKKKEEQPSVIKQITEIVSIITLIIYLLVSFMTMAWHITWIIWIVYALVIEIIKLIFVLRSNQNEK